MRIGLQTWGSEGDVRPFIALAAGLSANKHEVTLVISSPNAKDYSAYGAALDITIIHAHNTYKDWGDTFSAEAIFAKDKILSRNPIKQVVSIYEDIFEPAVDEMYEAAKALCANNDVVIGHYIHHPLQLAAQISNTPLALVVLSPVTIPSKYLAPSGAPTIGAWYNTLLWGITKMLLNKSILKFPNKLRLRENIPLANDMLSQVMLSNTLTLVATSPTLFEQPADWGDHLRVSGFLNMPDNSEHWEMPADLSAFIDYAEPPVFLTFGSITPLVQKKAMSLFVEAVKLSGCRAIIQSQWSEEVPAPQHPDIYTVESIPHQCIFPLCSLIVHHGGAGTSHSAARSGRPSVVVEIFGDQNFNASLLKKLGVTNNVLHFSSVSPKLLAQEINSVLADTATNQRAEEVRQILQKEDGVSMAVQLIEDIL